MKERTAIIEELYRRILQREPAGDELLFWASRCPDMASIPAVIGAFFESKEYKDLNGASLLGHPPGHYYSPINNVSNLDPRRFEENRRAEFDFIAPIDLSYAQLEAMWKQIAAFADGFDFPRGQKPGARYYFDNPVYGSGDALVLASMMAITRPKRIIEIGSGFSSACMLDVSDSLNLETEFVFVEPYPERLYGLLSESDRNRCSIIAEPVQQTNLALYRKLGLGDILLIDSTHVIKSCSDVATEIFNILPSLSNGVIIHFHDIFWPFEYPIDWVFNRKYSWNETYFVRAFLMYNKAFNILFFNDAFACRCRDKILTSASTKVSELFLRNPGGGLWIQKI